MKTTLKFRALLTLTLLILSLILVSRTLAARAPNGTIYLPAITVSRPLFLPAVAVPPLASPLATPAPVRSNLR